MAFESKPRESEHVETATLGAGCFWCLDAVARRIKGVRSSVVGYAGGHGPAPTYYELHRASSRGFVEAVQIQFDTTLLSLEDMLDLFFQSHDPTTPNQDGANFGPEYHSTIYYHSDEQRQRSLAFIEKLQQTLPRPIATTVTPYTTFYPAEQEHQNFYNENTSWSYCRVVIVPKLAKLGLLEVPPTIE